MGENSVNCAITHVLNSMDEFQVNVILYSETKPEYFLLTCVVVLVWFFSPEFPHNSSYSSGSWSICEHAAEQW